MITLESSNIVSIASAMITTIIGIASYLYTRKITKEDEKRKHSSVRNFEQKTDIFRRLEALEIEIAVLEERTSTFKNKK